MISLMAGDCFVKNQAGQQYNRNHGGTIHLMHLTSVLLIMTTFVISASNAMIAPVNRNHIRQ